MNECDHVRSSFSLQNVTWAEASEYIHIWNKFKQCRAKGLWVLCFRGRSDSTAILGCHKAQLKITSRSGFLICCIPIKWDPAWPRSCIDGGECKRSSALTLLPSELAEEIGRPSQLFLCICFSSLLLLQIDASSECGYGDGWHPEWLITNSIWQG